MSLGKAISRFRKQKDYTQSQLASLLGVHQTLVARWETDKVRPRDKTLERIAELLSTDVPTLIAAEQMAIALGLDDPEMLDWCNKSPSLVSPAECHQDFAPRHAKVNELEAVFNR